MIMKKQSTPVIKHFRLFFISIHNMFWNNNLEGNIAKEGTVSKKIQGPLSKTSLQISNCYGIVSFTCQNFCRDVT
jgi:hypothetical protein